MRRIICLTFVLTLLAPASQASVDCRILAGIAQIIQYSDTLRTSPRAVDRAIALEQLTAVTFNLDADSVFVALAPDLPIEAKPDLDRFFLLTDEILRLGRQANYAAIRHRLFQADAAETLRTADALLYGLGCIQTVVAAERVDPNDGEVPSESTSLTGLREILRSGRMDEAGGATLAGVGVVAAILMAYALNRRLALRRRRSRRYSLYLPLQVKHGGSQSELVIHDISALGAKLSHYGTLSLQQGNTLSVQLDGEWHQCSIQWVNGDYAGLKFEKRFKVARVIKILRDSKKTKTLENTPSNEDDTPQGAVPEPNG